MSNSIFVGGGTSGDANPGGASGAIQFNNAGEFGGFGEFDGANLKLGSDLITANDIVATSLGTFVDPQIGGRFIPGPSNGSTELIDTIGSDFGPLQTLYERYGVGTPEGAVTAPIGAIFHRVDGGTNNALYIKQSGFGNTGWASLFPNSPVIIRKSVDQTVQNNSLQADTELFFMMEANSVYVVEFLILCQSVVASADWRWNITVPVLATFNYGPGSIGTTQKWSPVLIGTAASPLEAAVIPWVSGSGNNILQGVAFFGIAICDSAPGNLQLFWAQNTTTPSDSTVKANSILRYQKVS